MARSPIRPASTTPSRRSPDDRRRPYASSWRSTVSCSSGETGALAPRRRRAMILVTGANGNVGAKTVRHLTNANHPVRALVRDPAKAPDLASIADVVVGDLGNPRTLTAAFAGVERAFVLAPVAPELEAFEANAFHAAAEAGVKHIVKLSNFGSGAFPTS